MKMPILLHVVWHRWKFRNETPEARKKRVTASREELRKRYIEMQTEWDALPDDRQLRECRQIMADAMKIILGADKE
jgi:hypothetical protein